MKTVVIAAVTVAILLGSYLWSKPSPDNANPAPVSQSAMAPELAASESFTVLETIGAGSYTYLRYEQEGMEVWIATQAAEVAVGDQIAHPAGMEMRDFYSKALDRTFSRILFVDDVQVLKEVAPKAIIDTAHAAQRAATAADLPAAPGQGEISPLESGMTVATVLRGYPDHAGQPARLRVRVMKVSEDVMGKNWVTLQDGSGNAPDLQLIATTSELVEPGDIVVVEGVIANDVSLGYGYDYKVLLEEAHFITET